MPVLPGYGCLGMWITCAVLAAYRKECVHILLRETRFSAQVFYPRYFFEMMKSLRGVRFSGLGVVLLSQDM